MEFLNDFNMKSILENITTEQIAIFSLFVTILIFILNRRAELKYKKYEDKKIEYRKLISLLNITYTEPEKMKLDKEGKPNKELQKDFFDTGASLMLYASKKLYKEYVFFREFSCSEHMKLSKYYDSKMIIYILANLMKQIRKEVGLANLNSVSSNEALAFFVNDIGISSGKKNEAIIMNYKIRMLKIDLFFLDIVNGVFLQYIYCNIIKSIFGIIRCIFIYIFFYPIIHLRNKYKKDK